jgi:hypothetical protein
MWHFDRECRPCQQKARNECKNEDRALAIIEARAGHRARQLGVTKDFMLMNMNWSALVPALRASMTTDGRCQSCGHEFVNERDIHIEHREPPREQANGGPDRAREHARNIGFLCHACNVSKKNKNFARWLDDEEDARLSNEQSNNGKYFETPAVEKQGWLFNEQGFQQRES